MSVASSMTPAEVKARWALVDTLLGGTEAMRKAGKSLLPQWEAESDETYKKRLASATLLPVYAETLEQMAGKVFAKPLTFDSVPAKVESDVLPNVDGAGNNAYVFAADWFTKGLNYGIAHVLIDMPRAPEGATLADANNRPTWRLVKPADVLGWKFDGDELAQVRILESVTENVDEWTTKAVQQIRVIEPGRVRLYRKTDADWELHDEFTTTMQAVPLVTFYANQTARMQGDPVLMELAHLNVEHWQERSDQKASVGFARRRMLYASGLDEGAELKASVDSIIILPQEGKIGVVQGSAESVKVGQDSLTDLQEQMAVAGAKLLTKSVLSMTDTQARNEAGKEVSRLGMLAMQFEDAMAQALQITADWLALGDGGGAKINADLDAIDPPAQTMELLTKMVATGVVSRETAFNEAKRRGVINAELDWQDEQERLSNGSLSERPTV